MPPEPTTAGPIFRFPIEDVTSSTAANQLTPANITLAFPGGTCAELGTIATATLVLQLAAVPERAVWLRMIGGFGLAGVALRRQPKRTLPPVILTSTS